MASNPELVGSIKMPGEPAAYPVAAGGTPGRGGQLVGGSHVFVNGVRRLLSLKEYWFRGEKKGGRQSNGLLKYVDGRGGITNKKEQHRPAQTIRPFCVKKFSILFFHECAHQTVRNTCPSIVYDSPTLFNIFFVKRTFEKVSKESYPNRWVCGL